MRRQATVVHSKSRNRGALAALGFCAVLLMATSDSALGFTPTVSSAGKTVRWAGSPKLNLAGNPDNRSGLPGSYFFNAVVRGLQRWNAASGGAVGFDYWQGSDDSVYEPNSRYNGLSSIYFISHDNTGFELDPTVIGLTQVWYDVETGRILEVDVAFNDADYVFTSDPADTSGSGAGDSSGYVGSRVYLENVLTHELGHTVGLSHGGTLQSTMLFLESPEQAKLSCDDILGVRSLYRDAAADGFGSVRGRVLTPGGNAVSGAHVVAISRDRGVVLATTLTATDGKFKIKPLEPGAYHLLIEPFYAGAGSLPAYYSNMNAAVCAGGSFSRTFVQQESGYQMRAFGVKSGSETNAGDLRVSCNGSRNANVEGPVGGFTIGSAPHAFATPTANSFGVVDRMNSGGSSQYYRLDDIEGDLEIRALSYSLYSPIRVQLALLDSVGNIVDSEVKHPVYEGSSGFRNFDSQVKAENLGRGNYVLRVTASYLSSPWYPASGISMDHAPFVLLTGRVNGSKPVQSSKLADNARCAISENFPAYSSPSGDPLRAGDDGGLLGFCGTVSARTERASRGTGHGPSAYAVLGWWLPWFAMGLIAYFNKLTIRLSSRRRLAPACAAVSASNTLER